MTPDPGSHQPFHYSHPQSSSVPSHDVRQRSFSKKEDALIPDILECYWTRGTGVCSHACVPLCDNTHASLSSRTQKNQPKNGPHNKFTNTTQSHFYIKNPREAPAWVTLGSLRHTGKRVLQQFTLEKNGHELSCFHTLGGNWFRKACFPSDFHSRSFQRWL